MADAIDTAPDNKIGTQNSGVPFPGRLGDSVDPTNVRSGMNGLDILFSAGTYMRLVENRVFLRRKLYRNPLHLQI